jgi:hypothetical protein
MVFVMYGVALLVVVISVAVAAVRDARLVRDAGKPRQEILATVSKLT